MRNLKRALAMGLSVVTVLSLTACGGSNTPSGSATPGTSTTPAAEGTATPDAGNTGDITIRFSWWGGDTRTAAYQEAIKAFEAANKGITIKAEYGAWDGWEKSMSTAFYGKTAPDVNQINWNWIESFSKDGSVFEDLNAYNEIIDLSQFEQSALDACTVAGELQAIPVALTGRTFFWNKSVFEKAGIDVPASIEDLLAAGKAFEEKLGKDYYPLALGEYDRMILMVHYLEAKYEKAWVVDGKVNFTEEEVAEGLKFIASLEENHVIPSSQKLLGDGAASLDKNQNWIDGHYAGIFEWDSAVSKYQTALDATQNFELIVGDALKGMEKGGFTKVALGLAITEGTKYGKECANFIEFLLNGDGAAIIGSELGVPLSKKGIEAAKATLNEMTALANAKVIANNSYPLDAKFEDAKLKNNTDGVYFTAMSDLSYDGVDKVNDIAKSLIEEINEIIK